MSKIAADYFNSKAIGEKIKQARESQNISRKKMCEDLDINPSTLQRIEIGKTTQPSYWLMRQIEDYLQINAVDNPNAKEYRVDDCCFIIKSEGSWNVFCIICDYILSQDAPLPVSSNNIAYSIPLNMFADKPDYRDEILNMIKNPPIIERHKNQYSFMLWNFFSTIQFCEDPFLLTVSIDLTTYNLIREINNHQKRE